MPALARYCGLKSTPFKFEIQLLTGQRLTFNADDGLHLNMKAGVLIDLVYRYITVSRKHVSERQFLGLKYINPKCEHPIADFLFPNFEETGMNIQNTNKPYMPNYDRDAALEDAQMRSDLKKSTDALNEATNFLNHEDYSGKDKNGKKSYKNICGPWLEKEPFLWLDKTKTLDYYHKLSTSNANGGGGGNGNSGNRIEIVYYLSVQYYLPDPTILLDESIILQFYLEIKNSLYNQSLVVSSQKEAANLSALLAQIEYGDFDKESPMWPKVVKQNFDNSNLVSRAGSINMHASQRRNSRVGSNHGSFGGPSRGPSIGITPSTPSTLGLSRMVGASKSEYFLYSTLAIGVSNEKPMTHDYDKIIYKAHKNLLGMSTKEARMKFIKICTNLNLFSMRKFCLCSQRALWLGLDVRGVHLFEVKNGSAVDETNGLNGNMMRDLTGVGVTQPVKLWRVWS